MRTLVETLYNYAQEHRVVDRLQTREYRQVSSGLEADWEDFRSALTADQEQRLESLLDRQFEAGILEDRAAFLAGVSIGLELARL